MGYPKEFNPPAHQVFDWLKRVADEALKKNISMSEVMGVSMIGDILQLEWMYNALRLAIMETNTMLNNTKDRAGEISLMVKDLM